MAEKMSLEQLKHWARNQVILDDVTEREQKQAIAAIDALTQPALAVDVDSLYEVIRGFGYTTRGQSDEIAEAVFEHITTRALAGEKAEGSVVVGYCHRDEAERLMDRKDQPKHTFTAIEVWNKRSDFYRIPVLLTLPTPPTDGEG